MILSCFLVLTYCRTETFSYPSEVSYIVFNNYGFSPGGAVVATFSGNNLSGIVFVLASSVQYETLKKGNNILKSLCFSAFQQLPYFGYSPKSSLVFDQWKTIIHSKGYRVPILANCNAYSFSFSLKLNNQNSYLDSRDQIIPYVYIVFAFLFCLFSIVWLVNIFCNLEFNIGIHTLFTFSSTLKIVALIFSAQKWIDLSNNDYTSKTTNVIGYVLTLVSSSVLFFANGAAAVGYGIFRSSLEGIETGNILFHSFMMVLSYYSSSAKYLSFFSGCLFVYYFLGYTSMIMDGIITFVSLNVEHPVLLLKKKQLNQYGSYYIFWLIMIMLCGLYSIFFDISNGMRILAEELFFLSIMIIDLEHFLIRKSHEPTMILSLDESIDELDFVHSIVLLKEPEMNEYAFLCSQA